MEDNLSVKEKELNVKLQETLKEKEKLEKMFETTVNELESEIENLKEINRSYYNKIMVQNERVEEKTFNEDTKTFDEFADGLFKRLKNKKGGGY